MTKTVLIVEDNELNMKLFRDLLEAHGIATIETRNGTEVLDIARSQKPDLILMDIQLPEVSGLDVTKWLKQDEALKAIPVIAVTAFAMKGDEEKIRQGGCEDYISKPISVMRFLEVIRRHLDKEREIPASEDGDEQADLAVSAGDAPPSFEIRERGGDDDEDGVMEEDLPFLSGDDADEEDKTDEAAAESIGGPDTEARNQ
ncbi:MAG: response regulator [Micavibrio sp.]